MLPRSLAVTSVLLLALAACGSEVTGAGSGGGGGAGSGGDAGVGGGDAPTSSSTTATGAGGGDGPCPEGATFRGGVLVPLSIDEGACLETEGVSTMDLCVFVEEPGTGFRCFERLATGRRIWLPTPEVLPQDVDAWVECTDEQPDPPPPCFVAYACFNDPPVFDGAIVSTCNDEDTRSAYACGGDGSPYDAGCCPRTLCDEDGGCPEGLVCRAAGFSSYTACSRSTDGTCGCFGTADAQMIDVCIAE